MTGISTSYSYNNLGKHGAGGKKSAPWSGASWACEERRSRPARGPPPRTPASHPAPAPSPPMRRGRTLSPFQSPGRCLSWPPRCPPVIHEYLTLEESGMSSGSTSCIGSSIRHEMKRIFASFVQVLLTYKLASAWRVPNAEAQCNTRTSISLCGSLTKGNTPSCLPHEAAARLSREIERQRCRIGRFSPCQSP